MTELQKAIKKELKRIRQSARRLEARGYEISKKKIPSYRPKDASRRTLERLKKINAKSLKEAKSTTYHGAASYGEQVSGKKGAKLERQAAAKKAARTRKKREELARMGGPAVAVDVIDEIRNMVNAIPASLEYRYAGHWIQGRETATEKSVMLSILDEATRNVTPEIITYYTSIKGQLEELAEIIHFESDGSRVEMAIARFAELLKGSPLSTGEKYALGEYSETLDFENWEE